MWQVLACGAAIVTLSMGVRHGFGLWLQPITQAQDWSRENFAMAIAIQNLTWGFAGIFSGMLADRFGAFRVIVTCAVMYSLGLIGMAYSDTPALFTATAGVLIGIAQAGTTYAVIYGVIGRNVSAAKRSWAMGLPPPRPWPMTAWRRSRCGQSRRKSRRRLCLLGQCQSAHRLWR